MLPKPAPQLSRLPPYIFVRLIALRDQVAASGKDVIDLGQGSPDLPTPPSIVEALCRSVKGDISTHRYPSTKGVPDLRRAIAAWYRSRFDVALDPDKEVLPLVGSKEGLAHLLSAYLSPGDTALVPSPCYPVHYNAVLLAGAKASLMPLRESNDFVPQLGEIGGAAARRAKVMILNYPNNPTGATIEGTGLFKEAIRFASKRSCLIIHDNAYSELCFDGYRAPSFLQVAGAKKAGVEFHSLSKSYNMAGWRIGFVVGNAEAIGALAKYKSFLDYGVPGFIQRAAVEALTGSQKPVEEVARTYQARRDLMVAELGRIGWKVTKPKASMYLWARVPVKVQRKGSLWFAEDMIRKAGVVVAPGVGFGPHGEGYVRFATVAPEDKLREAARRIGQYLK